MLHDATPIIDAHIHLFSVSQIKRIAQIVQEEGFLAINLAGIPAGLVGYNGVHYTFVSLLFKTLYPSNTYVFGGLDYTGKTPLKSRSANFAAQAIKYKDLGADGVKMLEGKPNARKELGVALDSPIYDEFFEWMQQEEFPILYHVSDPAEFWNPKKVPLWAKQNGWSYDQGGFPAWEQLQLETKGILKKFPHLNIIFAHFLFMSGDIDEASRFLDRWENVCFDLTPGIEMFLDFAREPKKWRSFFETYQDRIILGTDRTATSHTLTIPQLRKFLETDEPCFHGKGLGLSEKICRKIYADNFHHVAGDKPHPIDHNQLLAACKNRLETLPGDPAFCKTIQELKQIAEMLGEKMNSDAASVAA